MLKSFNITSNKWSHKMTRGMLMNKISAVPRIVIVFPCSWCQDEPCIASPNEARSSNRQHKVCVGDQSENGDHTRWQFGTQYVRLFWVQTVFPHFTKYVNVDSSWLSSSLHRRYYVLFIMLNPQATLGLQRSPQHKVCLVSLCHWHWLQGGLHLQRGLEKDLQHVA